VNKMEQSMDTESVQLSQGDLWDVLLELQKRIQKGNPKDIVMDLYVALALELLYEVPMLGGGSVGSHPLKLVRLSQEMVLFRLM